MEPSSTQEFAPRARRFDRARHVHRPHPPAKPMLSRLDRWGMLLSSICLVHCLLLPVIIAVLPAIAPALPGDFLVHSLIILLALPVTMIALGRGFRIHRSGRPLVVGGTGLGLVAIALPLSHSVIAESVLTVSGGLLVAVAHWLNWRSHSLLCHVPDHGH